MAAAALTCPKCKKTLRTAAPPGKKVKCPGCQTLITVPEAKTAPAAESNIKKPAAPAPKPPAGPAAKKPAAPVAKKPLAPPPAAAGKGKPSAPAPKGKPPAPPAKTRPKPVEDLDDMDDEDIDDESDEQEFERPSRPAKKKKKSGSMVFILAGGGIVALGLAAVAAFVYPGFLNAPTQKPIRPQPPIVQGGVKPPDNTNIPPDNTNKPPVVQSQSPLLAYIPADATFVGGVKPNSPLLKKLLDLAIANATQSGFPNIGELQAIVFGGNMSRGIIAIQTVKPFDRKKAVAETKAVEVPGKNFYADPAGDGFLAVPSDTLLIFGVGKGPVWKEEDFAAQLASQKPMLDVEFAAQVAAVENSAIWVIAANRGDLNQQLNQQAGTIPPDEIDKVVPGGKDAVPAATRSKFLRIALNLPANQGAKLDVALVCGDDKDAKKLSDLANELWNTQGKPLLPKMAQGFALQAKIDLGKLVDEVVTSFQVSSKAEVLSAGLQISDATLRHLEKIPFSFAPQGTVATQNNLKQIVLAMHSFHDMSKKLPPAASFGADGKPNLSWRVHILPFIEQIDLYQQFDLNAPWDDPKNKALLDRMPAIYKVVGRNAPPGETYMQVFVSDENEPAESSALFKLAKDYMITMAGITDGTSNTILVAEAEQSVPWTKPDDLHYSAKQPLPKLGDPKGDGFNVAMTDGVVFRVKRGVDETNLRRAIMANDGMPLAPDWIEGGKGEVLPIPPKTETKDKEKEPKVDPLPKVEAPPKVEPPPKVDPTPADPGAKNSLLYLPAYTDTIVSIDIDRIKNNALTAPLFQMVREPLESWDKDMWARLQNCQHACVGGSMETAKGVALFRIKNPITDDELRKGVNVMETHQFVGQNYHKVEVKGENGYATLVDGRHVLLGTMPDDDFTELLLPQGAPRYDAGLDKLISKISGAPLWAVIANKGAVNAGLTGGENAKLVPAGAELLPIAQRSKSFIAWCNVDDAGVDINLGLTAANKDDAAALQKQLDDVWQTKGKLTLQLLTVGVPKDAGFNAGLLIGEISDSLKLKAEGDLAYATVRLSKAGFEELQKAAKYFGKLGAAGVPGAINSGAADADIQKLQGKWKLEETEVNGTPTKPGPTFDKTFTVAGEKFFGMSVLAAELRTDSAKDPKWIDLTFTQAGNTMVMQGIYTLLDDEFKFCFSANPAVRPEGFETRGKQVQVFTTRRLKAE